MVQSMKQVFDPQFVNGGPMYIELSHLCIMALESMLADKEHIESWREPSGIKKGINKQIAYFKRILKDPKFRD